MCLKPPSREMPGKLSLLYQVLLRMGFTSSVSRHTVGELLPRLSTLTVFTAVYFCCTFLEVAFTRCYLAPCPVELGLSSCTGSLLMPATVQPTEKHLMKLSVNIYSDNISNSLNIINNSISTFSSNINHCIRIIATALACHIFDIYAILSENIRNLCEH